MVEDVKLYKVTDIVKRTSITREGEVEEFYEVYFETKSGIKSSITVPVKAKKEEIEKAVSEEAEKLEYVASLKR